MIDPKFSRKDGMQLIVNQMCENKEDFFKVQFNDEDNMYRIKIKNVLIKSLQYVINYF